MDRAALGVMDVARSVLAELDLDAVLDRVLESARSMTGARYAALGVLDASENELERFVTAGIDAATRREIGPLPRGRGVLGELIRSPQPLRLAEVSDHSRSYGFPPGHPPMHTFLGVPIRVGSGVFGNLYLSEKADGASFTDEDEEAVVMLAELAGFAIDHARRYSGAADRRDELERTVAALDATTQFSRAVGGQTDVNVILELVAKRGRALVSARAVLIEVADHDTMTIITAAGEFPPGLVGTRFPIEDTIAAVALRTGQIQRLEEEPNLTRFRQRGPGTLQLEADAGLVVPLIFQGRSYGVLVALDRSEDGPVFTDEDTRLLEAFATSAATALATARSAADDRRRQRMSAAEAERTRWARELHDETLQGLAGLRMVLSAAHRTGDQRALGDTVRRSVTQLDTEIENLRSLITDLRPAALDDLGLQAALEALDERASVSDLEIDTEIDLAFEAGRAATRHTPELEIAIYRIVQEALTNAARHGHARNAKVTVEEADDTVVVCVRDDGRGFDPRAATAGFGLLGMRERVELLEGRLTVESHDGAGTTISAELPATRQPLDAGSPAAAASDR